MLHTCSIGAWLRSCSCLFVAVMLVAPLALAQDKTIAINGLAPLSPQPGPDAMASGLAVEYVFQKLYDLSEIYEAEAAPVPGEPIPNLDTVTETDPTTGEDKVVNVLTSDQTILVGAFIRGAIHFAESGKYVLRVISNDGVRVWIGGAMIWDDPEVHFDRASPPLEIAIEGPGWYEFKSDYYQKKGSWALRVLWTPPGGEEMPVPPEAFGHVE